MTDAGWSLPDTFEEARAELCSWLERQCEDADFSIGGTGLELMAESWEYSTDEVLAKYGPRRLWKWEIYCSAESECTHRGAGWGSYYGPEPDEYRTVGWLEVLDETGAKFVDESWGEDGPPIWWERDLPTD